MDINTIHGIFNKGYNGNVDGYYSINKWYGHDILITFLQGFLSRYYPLLMEECSRERKFTEKVVNQKVPFGKQT